MGRIFLNIRRLRWSTKFARDNLTCAMSLRASSWPQRKMKKTKRLSWPILSTRPQAWRSRKQALRTSASHLDSRPLDKEERGQLLSMRDQIVKYIKLKGHARPLCLAVFGPPGSGKSFSVKEIGKEVNEKLGKGSSPQLSKMTTINLTQLSNPAELSATLVTTFVGTMGGFGGDNPIYLSTSSTPLAMARPMVGSARFCPNARR